MQSNKIDNIIKAIRLADLDNIKSIKVKVSDLVLLAKEIDMKNKIIKRIDRELMIANSNLYKIILEEPIKSLDEYV